MSAVGIQDRDYFREHHRRLATPARGATPSTAKIALLWIAVGVAIFAVFRFAPLGRVPTIEAPPPVGAAMRTAPVVPSLPRGAPPTRALDVEPDRSHPAEAMPIYRCGSSYSRSPCPGGRVVDGPASSGFDSRPSEKLARLVAEGRTADTGEITTSIRTVTTIGDASTPCPSLAQAIDAIDRAARQPRSIAQQDRLRIERQGVRSRQAANRC